MLKRGTTNPSSREQVHLHAHGYLPWPIFSLNDTYSSTIGKIPVNASTGSIFDVSPLLCFYFWKPIYLNSDDSIFPRKSKEETGRLVGISENVGHDVTFSILNPTSNKVVIRYNVSPEGNHTSPNIGTDSMTTPEVVTCRHLASWR